jgi:DNA-directed RNA polymerase subunit RPC12/RpoP
MSLARFVRIPGRRSLNGSPDEPGAEDKTLDCPECGHTFPQPEPLPLKVTCPECGAEFDPATENEPDAQRRTAALARKFQRLWGALGENLAKVALAIKLPR